jgi:predicted nucleic acid-binding protein
MASIWWEEPVAAPADFAWAALRHVGMAHQLFSPVLVDSTVEGDIRTVTFANGLVVRERIIAVDEQRRRIAYSVLGDTFDHHSASMQILPIDRASCRFLWVSDFLPHERADTVRLLVEQGSHALARNIAGGKALG